jgi:cytosine/adenosine deaminase-related metal-dependent hydrolase
MSRTLINGGWVLTMARTNHVQADVLIEGDKIVEVGTGLRARDASVIDASESIVMPGFIDAHRHAAESLNRNAADESLANRWSLYEPADIYAATLIGLLGAADAGITTVVDWCAVATNPDLLEPALQAHGDSNTRSVLVVPIAGPAGGAQMALNKAAATVPALTTLAAGIYISDSREAASVVDDFAAARASDVRIQLHLETGPAATDAIRDLADRGLLGEDVTVVHGSYLEDAALDLIAAAGSHVVLAPSEEMAAGLGAPPIQELIDRGVRPGLAVGTERISPGDAFAQMRAAISVQHATRFDLKLAGKAGLPKLMTTRDVIRHATIDGARAAGLDADTGSIEPGKQADIIVLSADRPNIYPINDPIGAVVWGMDTSNVEHVIIAGQPVKSDGRLTGDVGRARSLAIDAHRRVTVAAGVGSSTGDVRE